MSVFTKLRQKMINKGHLAENGGILTKTEFRRKVKSGRAFARGHYMIDPDTGRILSSQNDCYQFGY